MDDHVPIGMARLAPDCHGAMQHPTDAQCHTNTVIRLWWYASAAAYKISLKTIASAAGLAGHSDLVALAQHPESVLRPFSHLLRSLGVVQDSDAHDVGSLLIHVTVVGTRACPSSTSPTRIPLLTPKRRPASE